MALKNGSRYYCKSPCDTKPASDSDGMLIFIYDTNDWFSRGLRRPIDIIKSILFLEKSIQFNRESLYIKSLRKSKCHSSDRPKHRGGNFAARRNLYACDHRFVNGYESTDQVRGIVPVPPMEMKGNGTVLEHPTTPSASEEQPCPVSTSRQFAGRSRSSRCWTGSASSPRTIGVQW